MKIEEITNLYQDLFLGFGLYEKINLQELIEKKLSLIHIGGGDGVTSIGY